MLRNVGVCLVQVFTIFVVKILIAINGCFAILPGVLAPFHETKMMMMFMQFVVAVVMTSSAG